MHATNYSQSSIAMQCCIIDNEIYMKTTREQLSALCATFVDNSIMLELMKVVKFLRITGAIPSAKPYNLIFMQFGRTPIWIEEDGIVSQKNVHQKTGNIPFWHEDIRICIILKSICMDSKHTSRIMLFSVPSSLGINN